MNNALKLPDYTKQALKTMDREYQVDIHGLQAEFAKIDTSNPTSLRSWFLSHPYLSAHDHARVANISQWSVYRWRKRAGLKTTNQKPPSNNGRCNRRFKLPKLIAPPNWDNAWVVEQYNFGYSIPNIAEATNRAYLAIYGRLKRHGTIRSPRQSTRSTNPCCTKKWVTEHYVERGLSKNACSKLAGVSRWCFSVWLDIFGIRARSVSEQALIDNVTDISKETSPVVFKERRNQIIQALTRNVNNTV